MKQNHLTLPLQPPASIRRFPAAAMIAVCLAAAGSGILLTACASDSAESGEASAVQTDTADTETTAGTETSETQAVMMSSVITVVSEQTETSETTPETTTETQTTTPETQPTEPQTQPVQEDPYTAALRAYAVTLQHFMQTGNYQPNNHGDAGCSMYDLCDINQDGIPELIISYTPYYGTESCELYTYRSGASEFVAYCGAAGTVGIVPSQHLVMNEGTHMGYLAEKYYDFNGHSLSLRASFFTNEANVTPGMPVSYQHNDTEVSKEAFDAAYAPYLAMQSEMLHAGRAYSFPNTSNDWQYVGNQKIN